MVKMIASPQECNPSGMSTNNAIKLICSFLGYVYEYLATAIGRGTIRHDDDFTSVQCSMTSQKLAIKFSVH